MHKEARTYRAPDGSAPFEDWVDQLKDTVGRIKIRVRLRRVMQGNLGDYRPIGSGIIELRIDFGPGYRLYAGLHGPEVIVILCGGDKKSQKQDIAAAHGYWDDYKRRL